MNSAGWEKLKEQILIVLADYQTMSPDFCDKAIQRQGTRNDIARRIVANGKLCDDTPGKLQHLQKELFARAATARRAAKENGCKHTGEDAARMRAFEEAASLVEELLKSEGL